MGLCFSAHCSAEEPDQCQIASSLVAVIPNKIGMILIGISLFGLVWGGLTSRPEKRSSTSDRFTLLAMRHIIYRCLQSPARWFRLRALCSWLPAKKINFPQQKVGECTEERRIHNVDTAYHFVVSFRRRRILWP